MIPYPAVVVHGLAQACVALAPQRPVVLLSSQGAGIFAGAGWWRALIAAARAAHPTTEMRDILDCGAAPGRALEALRVGQHDLRLDPSCAGFASVASVALAVGATLHTERPPALDLAERGAARRLDAWLGIESSNAR